MSGFEPVGGPVTPLQMLEQYRLQSPDDVREQAKMFVGLSSAQRHELLFYMMCHLTAGLQSVHAQVDAAAARVTPFDQFKVTKQ